MIILYLQPHLRNLFFRSSALLTLNIRPIFVLDGDAPELKRTEMINRRNAELGSQHATQDSNNEKGNSDIGSVLDDDFNAAVSHFLDYKFYSRSDKTLSIKT